MRSILNVGRELALEIRQNYKPKLLNLPQR